MWVKPVCLTYNLQNFFSQVRTDFDTFHFPVNDGRAKVCRDNSELTWDTGCRVIINSNSTIRLHEIQWIQSPSPAKENDERERAESFLFLCFNCSALFETAHTVSCLEFNIGRYDFHAFQFKMACDSTVGRRSLVLCWRWLGRRH